MAGWQKKVEGNSEVVTPRKSMADTASSAAGGNQSAVRSRVSMWQQKVSDDQISAIMTGTPMASSEPSRKQPPKVIADSLVEQKLTEKLDSTSVGVNKVAMEASDIKGLNKVAMETSDVKGATVDEHKVTPVVSDNKTDTIINKSYTKTVVCNSEESASTGKVVTVGVDTSTGTVTMRQGEATSQKEPAVRTSILGLIRSQTKTSGTSVTTPPVAEIRSSDRASVVSTSSLSVTLKASPTHKEVSPVAAPRKISDEPVAGSAVLIESGHVVSDKSIDSGIIGGSSISSDCPR